MRSGAPHIYVTLVNYGDYNLDFRYDLIDNSVVISAGSYVGAHCGVICDAAMPTFTPALSLKWRAELKGHRACARAALFY